MTRGVETKDGSRPVNLPVVLALGAALLAFLGYLFYAQFLRTPPF